MALSGTFLKMFFIYHLALDKNGNQENSKGMDRSQAKSEWSVRWSKVKESKSLLEGVGKWVDLPAKETRKLQKDGKQKRQDLENMKKKRFGKAGNCHLTETEEAILSIQMKRIEELTEMEMNLRIEKMRSKKCGRVERSQWVKKAGKRTESATKKPSEGRKAKNSELIEDGVETPQKSAWRV